MGKMAAKKCFDNYESVEVHSLPFASWRMRKDGDGTQSESEALRTAGWVGWGWWRKSQSHSERPRTNV